MSTTRGGRSQRIISHGASDASRSHLAFGGGSGNSWFSLSSHSCRCPRWSIERSHARLLAQYRRHNRSSAGSSRGGARSPGCSADIATWCNYSALGHHRHTNSAGDRGKFGRSITGNPGRWPRGLAGVHGVLGCRHTYDQGRMEGGLSTLNLSAPRRLWPEETLRRMNLLMP
jgi:hypothetical protein